MSHNECIVGGFPRDRQPCGQITGAATIVSILLMSILLVPQGRTGPGCAFKAACLVMIRRRSNGTPCDIFRNSAYTPVSWEIAGLCDPEASLRTRTANACNESSSTWAELRPFWLPASAFSARVRGAPHRACPVRRRCEDDFFEQNTWAYRVKILFPGMRVGKYTDNFPWRSRNGNTATNDIRV